MAIYLGALLPILSSDIGEKADYSVLYLRPIHSHILHQAGFALPTKSP